MYGHHSTFSVGPPAASETAVGIAPRLPLPQLNEQLEAQTPAQIIRWAAETFDRSLCLTASFADTLLIAVATSVVPDVEVLFLDTGFHFPETIDTMHKATAHYDLNLTVLRPPREQANVWRDGPTSCCEVRKVLPLDDALRARGGAWLTGLRRSDSPERADTPIVQRDRRGLIKINPLAAWTDHDVDEYLSSHAVLANPLTAQGYESIGCWPCTEPSEGRQGRWAGEAKTECGLHL